MAIEFDGAEIAEVAANMTALAARFTSVTWKYETDNATNVRYTGYLASPYNSNTLRMELSVPLSGGTDHTYTQTRFYFKASGNLSLTMPEPDSATRVNMTSITTVGDWLEGFVDSLS